MLLQKFILKNALRQKMKLTRSDDELVLMVLNEKIKKQSSFDSHEKAAAGRIIWFDSRSWSCITLSYIWKNISGFELLLAEPGPGLTRQRNNFREPTDLEQLCVWGKKNQTWCFLEVQKNSISFYIPISLYIHHWCTIWAQLMPNGGIWLIRSVYSNLKNWDWFEKTNPANCAVEVQVQCERLY